MLRRTNHTCTVLMSRGFLLCVLLFPSTNSFAEDDGSVLRTLIPAVAYGTTFYMDDYDGRIQFYKSFFTNFATTWTLKEIISKERPNGKDPAFSLALTIVSIARNVA